MTEISKTIWNEPAILGNMKNALLIALLLTVRMFAQGTSNVADLAWMVGHWGPVASEKRAAASEEHWIPAAGGMMMAVSRTVVRGEVVEFEFLRIETRADGLYYVAQPGGQPPVAFKLTKSTKDSVVFENPQHDHPKIIEYRLDGPNALVATIEGDEGGKHKKQSFRFERMKQAASEAGTRAPLQSGVALPREVRR